MLYVRAGLVSKFAWRKLQHGGVGRTHDHLSPSIASSWHMKMFQCLHTMLFLSVLVAFAACDAPPVPLDDIIIEKTFVPEQCLRAVKVGDYVRYHYNGMFPDGKKFDSRWGNVLQNWRCSLCRTCVCMFEEQTRCTAQTACTMRKSAREVVQPREPRRQVEPT